MHVCIVSYFPFYLIIFFIVLRVQILFDGKFNYKLAFRHPHYVWNRVYSWQKELLFVVVVLQVHI